MAIAESLLAVASSLRIVELPDLPPAGDVTDWRNAGGTADDLRRFVAETPVHTIETLREWRSRACLDNPAQIPLRRRSRVF